VKEPIPLCSTHQHSTTVRKVLECYNVTEENKDPRNLQIPETEGECAVEGPEIESVVYVKSLKTHKVNIGT
jgi:hypothetical protein